MRRVFASILLTAFLFPLSLFGATSSSWALSRSIVSIPVTDQKGNQITLYEESHALVIGISEYTGGWPSLPGVKGDVKAVRDTLENIGFNVVVVEDPDQQELEAAFKDFVLEYGLNPENRLLFYFAGHGHTHKPYYAANDPEEWMGYLVARNAPDPQEDISRFFAHSLSMRAIEGIALTIEAKHAMFIFDSCFSGTLFGLSRAIPQDIQLRTGKPVRQFITSGTADQVVPDISIFRRQFISALEGEADSNRDGYITGSELGLYLEETVTNLSRRTQTPRYGKIQNRLLNKGDFVFPIQWDSSDSEAVEPALTVAEDAAPDQSMDNVIAKAEDLPASRGERSRRIENHFKKLKNLDKFEETDVSRKTKIKLWGDFIALYPASNLLVQEAERILKNLKDAPNSAETSRKGEIYAQYASLMELDQGRGPLDEKINSWEAFMKKYPRNNSYLDIAQKRLQQLKNKKYHEEIELKFDSLMKMDEQDLEADQKIAAWREFLQIYPDNNPKKGFAFAKIQRIEEGVKINEERKRLVAQRQLTEQLEAQKMELETITREREALRKQREDLKKREQAFRREIERMAREVEAKKAEELRQAEEKRLAEEAEARRLEEKRRAEEKRLAEEAEARRLEEKRRAEEKRLAEEAEARRLEEKRRAEEKRLAEEAEARRLEEKRRAEEERLAEEAERLQKASQDNPQVARLEPGSPKSSGEASPGQESMVLIPAGGFVAGKRNSPSFHSQKGFYIDTHEVTQKEFERVMGKNPSRFKGEDRPVEMVTWDEAQEYCRRVGKRLPNASEWEKAARGGTSSKYYWGNELGENKANCDGCGSKFDSWKTAPVGSFPPNNYGLYDIVGNVWEWIDQTYESKFKVLRGGSYMDDSSFVTPEGSYFLLPKNRSADIGFRCVR